MKIGIILGVLSVGALISIPGAPKHTASSNLEPLTSVLYAGVSGTVREVKAQAGDAVRAGQVLLELEIPELDAAASAVRLERLAAGIPAGLRGPLIDAHASVLAAEAEYVAALESGSRVRLARAAEQRQSVRRRIARMFETSSPLVSLEKRLREQATLRAAADATVDLLNVRAGDHVEAGRPLAVLAVASEYTAELVNDQLQPGMQVQASLGSRTLPAIVESAAMRRVPFGLRQDRRVAAERVVRLRLHSEQPIPAGAAVTFAWP